VSASANSRGAELRPIFARRVVVGGGLTGGLIALAFANEGRGRDVVLVERDTALGGNHTWSYHETDLDEEGHALLAPLVTHRWSTHLVRFPGLERRFRADYRCVTHDAFDAVLRARLRAAGVRLRLGRAVSALGRSEVRLDDGTTYFADVVIDARGPEAPAHGAFQKFVGLELELQHDGPWQQPVLMDATVAQVDGYRFMYVLPFSRRHVLVEDTTYSSRPTLDMEAIERRVLAYVEERGARVARVLRREHGVLPLSLRAAEPSTNDGAAIAVGYRGGFYHPVTGYSLPLAARVALLLAKARTRAETLEAVRTMERRLEPQRRFGQLLNRLMFEAMPSAVRWTALERFYRLPEPTIARFYASRSTWWDRARMLLGRPPRGISWRHLMRTPGGEA
jgi:lycopene beta-cyclase